VQYLEIMPTSVRILLKEMRYSTSPIPTHQYCWGLGSSSADEIKISGNYAYVAGGSLKYSMFRSHITSEIELWLGQYVNGIAVPSNDHAYMTTLYTGLEVIDISNPGSPATISDVITNINTSLMGNCIRHPCLCFWRARYQDNRHFESKRSGVREYNPFGLACFSRNDIRDYAYVTGFNLYTTEYYFELIIIDISNPEAPIYVKGTPIPIFLMI